MREIMQTLYLAGLLLALSPMVTLSVFAQEKQGDQQKPLVEAVRGVVAATKSGNALPGAIIEFRSQVDSALVSKTHSEPDGRFIVLVKDIQPGKYFVKATFPGHAPATTIVPLADRKEPMVDLGRIDLKPFETGLPGLSNDLKFTGEAGSIEPVEQTVAIMHAALEHVVGSTNFLSSLAKVSIDPASIVGKPYDQITDDGTIIPADPASTKVHKLVEELAARTMLKVDSFEDAVRCLPATPIGDPPPGVQGGIESPDCWFEGEGIEAFLVPKIPEVHGSKARLSIHTLQASSSPEEAKGSLNAIGRAVMELELKREADGQWRVTGVGATLVN